MTAATYTVNGKPATKEEYDASRKQIDQMLSGGITNGNAQPSAVNGNTTSTPTVQPTTAATLASAPSGNKPAPSGKFAQNPKGNAPPTVVHKFIPDFIVNELDKYDQYTYHWKLYMTSLDNVYKGTVLEPQNHTIIAESGVSDLTIDKVEIHGLATPTVQTGTGTQTDMKFEITEPAGAGLIDKMFYESLSLGIGNWMVMPLFLELEFRGRDPESSETFDSGMPGPLGENKWVWPIQITDMKANVTTMGTRYSVTAIFMTEHGQSNTYFSLQHNTVLKKLTNVQSAMDDLAEKLNQDAFEAMATGNYSLPDVYKIIVDPTFAEKPLIPNNANKHSSRAGDYIDFDKKTATYNANTSIDKIIDSILGATAYFQEKLQSSNTPTSTPKSANEADSMRKIWRITTETRPYAFDPMRQNNALEIAIYIVEYDIGVLEADAAQVGETPDTLPAAKKRVNTYIQKDILKKVYNYIYTGLNDQIHAFELNLKFSFLAALSRFNGIYYDTTGKDKGIVNQDFAKEELNIAKQFKDVLQFINNAKPGDNVDSKISNFKTSVAKSKLTDDQKARYTKLMSIAKPADRRAFIEKSRASGGITANGEYITAKKEATSIADTSQTGALRFVSDVNINSAAAKGAVDATQKDMALRRGKLRPIAFGQSNQEANLVDGIEPTSDAARARTSSVFATALYSSLDASLQSIKMTIKGDPFWLYPTSIPKSTKVLPYKAFMKPVEAIKSIKEAHILHPETVNPTGTDNFIVVRFRTPRLFEDVKDDADPFKEIETFSGIYKVTTITSKFEMGKFSQELTAILDPNINLVDFRGVLIDIEKSQGYVPSPIKTSTTNANMPPNTIKTDRLTNNVTTGVSTNTGSSSGKQLSNVPSIDSTIANKLLSDPSVRL